jgi:putative Holliday junction resolvase
MAVLGYFSFVANNGCSKRQAMSIVALEDLPRLLSPGQRLLGLDLGEKTIGLALTDTLLMVATPLKTLKRGKFRSDVRGIQHLIAEHGIGALVVGLPLNMDGSTGPSAQSAQAFARNFAAISDCPVLLADERLSTAAVTRTLLDADASRLRRRAVVDKMAAAYVLQGVLDRLARMKSAPPP